MTTLGAMLRTNAQLFGAHVAIRDDAGDLRWHQYVDRIARVATVLREKGLAVGARYGILSRNCVEQALLLNAGYWSGAVPVPINFRLAPTEVAELLADANCQALFVDRKLSSLLREPALKPWQSRAVEVEIDSHVRNDYQDLVSEATPLSLHEGNEIDDALLLYTGGTTGRGKGVPLSHRNILSNALQLARVMNVGPNDTYLHAAPMFHSADLKSTVVSLFGGAHVYLKEFSPEGVVQAARRHQVSILSLIPTMIARLLDGISSADCVLPSLRLITYGSSPMDEALLRRAMVAFPGIDFQQCYGLTETSPFLAVLDEDTHTRALQGRPELLRAAGRPLPATEIRLVDETGRTVPAGSDGEVTVRGPQVARGYLDRPEEQAAAWRDGWFFTGDIGRMDADGLLYILGRRKDIVITGGENVYTREVENVLASHPQIAEVAVIGVPDPAYGEALLAAIVCRKGETPTPETLIDFCRPHLGGFKIPRQFRFVTALPRTAMGKLRKQDLLGPPPLDLNPTKEPQV